MRKIVLLLLIAFLIVPLSAEEVFYQYIINASYLPDFAFGAVPLSLWGDFGVSGVELIPGMGTRLYMSTKAGILERTLRQDPMTGALLDHGSYSYSVAFSDENFVLEQELIKNPKDGSTLLRGTASARMRWEQAFATLRDIRNENYGGIFEPEMGIFPSGGDVFLKGTPELSGDKYFMAASFLLGLDYFNSWNSLYGHNSYGISLDMDLAPSWFFNDLWFIDEVYTDAYEIGLGGFWNINFVNAKTESGRQRFSLQLSNSLNSKIVFGSSVPRFMLDRSFMGTFVVTRNFYTSFRSQILFKGPQFLVEGTYPQVYAYFENAINSGNILNAEETHSGSFEFYGGVGVGGNIYFMKFFNFFAELKYVYTDNIFSNRGPNFSMGMYVNLFAI